MKRRNRGWAILAAIAVAAACGEQPAEPARPGAPVFSAGGAAPCPTPATTVVTSEAALLAALAAASPGDVIGINGTIAVTASVVVASSVTLTCVTPGSGLAVAGGAVVSELLSAEAPFVTIDRLVLNGAGTTDPFVAFRAANGRFTNNDVTCGTDSCAFFIGTPGSVIAGNRFISNGSLTGVHIQPSGAMNPDGVRVERNRIVATAPSGSQSFGGIRTVGGINVVIANNSVLGPWQNSISPTSALTPPLAIEPVVAGNSLTGAVLFGVRLSAGGAGVIRVRDGVFRNNRVSGAGLAGVLVVGACNNLFVGNDLQGNANGIGIQFVSPAGGNTFVGNENVAVDGAAPFDCNGDGVPDPNVINGSGAVLTGVNLGAVVSDGVAESNADQCFPPTAGLTSWWPGDGNARDVIGGNHGELFDATFAPAKVLEGFSFDGVGDVVVAPGAGIDGLQQLTIAAWVKHNSLPLGRIERYVTLNGEKAVLRYDGENGPAQLHFYMRIDRQLHHIRVNNVLQVGVFHHVAGSYDGAVMRLYLDGVEVGSLAVTGVVDAGGGVIFSSNTETLDGLLDEIEIFDHALNASQVRAILRADDAGKCRTAFR